MLIIIFCRRVVCEYSDIVLRAVGNNSLNLKTIALVLIKLFCIIIYLECKLYTDIHILFNGTK